LLTLVPSVGYWVLRERDFKQLLFFIQHVQYAVWKSDKSGSGHHSSCEIVTFVWSTLRGTPPREETVGWCRGEHHTYTK
jgi:hypothetical protein